MKLAVIVPTYRVRTHILATLAGIGPEVSAIFVVDDACPEGSGQLVKEHCRDPRVRVLTHPKNKGVGGAVITGLTAAANEGFELLVKLDGDGQMDPTLISAIARPIAMGKADYSKGNRFFSPVGLRQMPVSRLVGNAGLSFLAKATTGYWNVMDPTNGFFAIHASILPLLDLPKISERYFFETDMLYRLGLARVVVADVPMQARYADEKSGLSVTHSLFSFPPRLVSRFTKRIFYRYFLRDFNLGSVLLTLGSMLMLGGGAFGFYHWRLSAATGHMASSGTVMLAALPVFLGFQMLSFALMFDVLTVPNDPVHPHLRDEPARQLAPLK